MWNVIKNDDDNGQDKCIIISASVKELLNFLISYNIIIIIIIIILLLLLCYHRQHFNLIFILLLTSTFLKKRSKANNNILHKLSPNHVISVIIIKNHFECLIIQIIGIIIMIILLSNDMKTHVNKWRQKFLIQVSFFCSNSQRNILNEDEDDCWWRSLKSREIHENNNNNNKA